MKNTIKQIIRFLFISLIFFVAVNIVSAQEASEANARKYGITFPVAELGNCANISSCKTYCDDQTHRTQCTAFAKKKGFYKEEPNKSPINTNTIMQVAKSELGCQDQASCNQFCSQEQNRQKCSDFAKKNNLDRPDQQGEGPGDQKILQKAKEILGCNSESSCRSICEQESNRDKCSRFAKEAGIDGGVRRVGPGGCDSEESCRAYCDSHEEECRKFGGGPEGGDRRGGPRDKNGQPEGSGGPVCTTRDECEAFCKNPANAEACKNVVINKDENVGPKPEEVRAQMGKLRENILQMPAESQACLKNALGAAYDKIIAGEPLTSPIDGGAMQACFAQGVKEYEEKEMLKKPKKADDFSTEFGPSGAPVNDYQIRPTSEIPQQVITQVPQVQGISTKYSLLNAIFNWFISLNNGEYLN